MSQENIINVGVKYRELTMHDIAVLEHKAGFDDKPVTLSRSTFDMLLETVKTTEGLAKEYETLYDDGQTEIKDLKEEISDLEDKVEEKELEITDLEEKLENQQKEIKDLEAKIKDLEIQINNNDLC